MKHRVLSCIFSYVPLTLSAFYLSNIALKSKITDSNQRHFADALIMCATTATYFLLKGTKVIDKDASLAIELLAFCSATAICLYEIYQGANRIENHISNNYSHYYKSESAIHMRNCAVLGIASAVLTGCLLYKMNIAKNPLVIALAFTSAGVISVCGYYYLKAHHDTKKIDDTLDTVSYCSLAVGVLAGVVYTTKSMIEMTR